MDHYIDIRLRRDPEFPQHHLMSALYSRLHRALVVQRDDNIGVSFPDFSDAPAKLGEVMRLHGSPASLNVLMESSWLTGMHDHLQLSAMQPVPPGAQHRRVMRAQAKSSPERLRRRAMRRHNIDADEARKRIPDNVSETLRLPFVRLSSQSTGQTAFPLFVRHDAVQKTAIGGGFTTYGLSQGATVPWF